MFKNKSFLFAGLVFLIAVSALAHKGEHHGDQKKEEPKVHLDMTKDFPFAGHGTPMEDLEAIQSSLEKGRMPPFRYRAMHWSSRIGTDDLSTIQTWIKNGLTELRSLKTK